MHRSCRGARPGATVATLLLLCLLPAASAFGSFSLNNPAATNVGGAKGDLSKIPVVIAPGFGNDQIDYSNPLKQGEEYGFISALERRGFDRSLVTAMPLERFEWVRVAGGLFDVPNFYTGTCRPEGLGYGWYVKRLRKTIEEAYAKAGSDEKVILIGHSAGGWLARAALGDGSWNPEGDAGSESGLNGSEPRASDRVRALITVGAIHKPPAGRRLRPGEGISYVTVGGDAITGKQLPKQTDDDAKGGSEDVNKVYNVRGEGSASSVAYTSYEAVSGNGELTGDGVVPLEWSLLEGSRTIVLDGVLHSINEAGTTLPTDRWYGAEPVVDRWLSEALKEAGVGKKSGNPVTTMFENLLNA